MSLAISSLDFPKTRGRPVKYPFRQLEVGDSFLVPEKSVEEFRSLVTYWNKRIKVSSRRYAKFSLTSEGSGCRVCRRV